MIGRKCVGISDSFNYTFSTMGSVYGIIILNTIAQFSAENHLVVVLHISSLLGIIYINREYYRNFRSNHYFGRFLDDPDLPPFN
jgi:hypothetical protein